MVSHSKIKSIRGTLRNDIDPFELPERTFIKCFRLGKAQVRELIEDVRPFIPLSPRSGSLTIENKVLAALRFYATGSYQNVVGDSWYNCMSRTSAGYCIRDVTDALCEPSVQRKHIKFPRTSEERRRLIAKNLRALKFPAVGFVDGTEIPITTPFKRLNPQAYWTRKHQYALNCQVICDSDLQILNIKPDYPGSCNDKFVFKNSAARRRMIEAFREEPCWLLGDGGYTEEPWLMIPIKDAAPGSAEERYTKRHCKARCCVERCIGVMKGRFRCLLRARVLHYQPCRAAKIVKACAVLHNICTKARLPRFPAVAGEEDPIPAEEVEGGEAVVDELREDVEEDAEDPQLRLLPGDGAARQNRVRDAVRQRLVDFFAVQAAQDENEQVNGDGVEEVSEDEE